MIINGSQSKSEYLNPFMKRKGDYEGRNQIEQYLRLIFETVDNDDGPGLKELFDELTHEQHIHINGILASYTRAKIKQLTGDL